ncbi:MAG TPA: DUF4097 family beta strand repeat-containing protein [Pyrinomonadaceae bacterium]|nr:DUF4097 family beta strand repeat-containing protein [Pyrinomonadaceae bacterium]
MKKAALLIAILSITAAAMAHQAARRAYSAVTPELTEFEPIQKPKGDELTEEFHQSYPLALTGRVSIANINGDVRISAWDRNEVKIDAVKRAYNRERLSEATIDVTNTADSISIRTKYPERNPNFDGRNWSRENNPASVEYTLTVPRGARIDGVELVNGSLDIEGVHGEVRASLVNGKVKANDLSGEISLSSVNGAIEVSAAGLTESKGVNLNAVNGSIVLSVPSGTSAHVRASTVHGQISNDFGLTVEEGQYVGRNLSGQIGSGGPRIRLNNVNGSISIKRGGVAF